MAATATWYKPHLTTYGRGKVNTELGPRLRGWRAVCEGFNSDLIGGVEFLRLGLDARQAYRPNYSVDWWPKNQIGERRNPRSRPGYITTWETRAGTLHTASLLREAEGDTERQHAILIMASLWDKDKDLPHEWRGRCYRMLQDVEEAVRGRHPVERWHHASRSALPLSVLGGGRSRGGFPFYEGFEWRPLAPEATFSRMRGLGGRDLFKHLAVLYADGGAEGDPDVAEDLRRDVARYEAGLAEVLAEMREAVSGPQAERARRAEEYVRGATEKLKEQMGPAGGAPAVMASTPPESSTRPSQPQAGAQDGPGMLSKVIVLNMSFQRMLVSQLLQQDAKQGVDALTSLTRLIEAVEVRLSPERRGR